MNDTLAVVISIWKGYLNYIPDEIPHVDTVGIIYEIFLNSTSLVEHDNGDLCLHKETIKSGIHRKAVEILGNKCCACGILSESSHIHHVKRKEWSWGKALGFIVLCEDCHKVIHTNKLGISDKQLKQWINDRYEKRDCESDYLLSRRTIDGAINYYTLA